MAPTGAIKIENFAPVKITSEHELWKTLSLNFRSTDSVWLITFKKSAPDRYTSREQVLVALIAHGWIDSIWRKLDDKRTMQLVSSRNTQSWTETYKQRAKRLEAEGRMRQSGRNAIKQSKLLGLWYVMQDVDTLIVPNDLQIFLDKDRVAGIYFENCPPSYNPNILRWLKSAKTQKTRQKRLENIFTGCKAENRIPQM